MKRLIALLFIALLSTQTIGSEEKDPHENNPKLKKGTTAYTSVLKIVDGVYKQ